MDTFPQEEKLIRVIARCKNVVGDKQCGEFLMSTAEQPNLTYQFVKQNWTNIVLEAPPLCPQCPKCGHSSNEEYNVDVVFSIHREGQRELSPKQFFALNLK